ncbi:MAG TPA: hypothetical protein VKD23_14830, partial [Terriglobales bacterium]|nr:hypothetical protein [Terriglobales bacterium]
LHWYLSVGRKYESRWRLSLRSIVRHTIGQLSVYPWTFWNGRAALETGPNTCGKRNFLAGVGLRFG